MISIPDLLGRLQDVQKKGNVHNARCPCHNDLKASLSVSMGNNGAIVLHCHAGCDKQTILTALGLAMADLYPNGNLTGNVSTAKPKAKIVATYAYTDETGQLLYETVRYQPKDFRQRQPKPGGKWIWSITNPPVRKVLYNLPLLLGLPNEWVYLVEGEKDAGNVLLLGLVATTNAMGAKKWEPEYTQTLKGRKVCILPDNDVTGQDHAKKIAAELNGVAADVRILNLPGLGAKEDVSDWIARGGTADELKRLTNQTTGQQTTRQQAGPQPLPSLVDFELSDQGNAEAALTLYPDQFVYTTSHGWLSWTGTHWDDQDADAAVHNMVVRTLRKRIETALQANPHNSDRLIRFCVPNTNRVQATITALKSITRQDIKYFDAEPDFLNCLNGVVDLRTGQLLTHTPSQLFTHIVPVEYNSAADYVFWLEVMSKNVRPADLEYLRLASGYSLTGHTREEVLFYLWGKSRSGKGTFTETLAATLGDRLAKELPFSTFTEDRTGDSQNFDLAPLKNCRVVLASETNEYERLNEAKVKALTGGNQVYCAFKHRVHFNYRPQYKLWLSANAEINANPTDDAAWGRFRPIEFPHSYLGAEDKMLKEILRRPEMLQGVLAWCVSGGMDWYKLDTKGLPELASMTAYKQKRRTELDSFAEWLNECVQPKPGNQELNAKVFQSYELWCKNNGVTHKRNRAFTQEMKQRGYANRRITLGMIWLDIEVR